MSGEYNAENDVDDDEIPEKFTGPEGHDEEDVGDDEESDDD